MKIPRAVLLAAAAFLLTPIFPAAGQETKPAPEPARKNDAAGKDAPGGNEPGGPKDQKPVVSQHSITIGGKVVPYRVTTGYLLLKDELDGAEASKAADEKGGKAPAGPDALKAKARIFFVAYTRSDVDAATRPVSFAFNGGPGAASVWLHLGALGPRRVKVGTVGSGSLPPYHLLDNASSWLDETDLVFIDPVSTGFSRPAAGEAARSFHGYEEDLRSVAQFIRDYITQNNRWLSPKYVIGESYGGTRAAALAGALQDRSDIYLNGIVIVSGVLNWQTIDFRAGNDLPYPLYLPAYTSAAWYHQKLLPELQQRPLDDVRREAESFAMNEYLLALAKGSQLPASDRTRLVEKLAKYSGLPAELISRYNLRVPAPAFMDELLKKENHSVGRFDSRAAGIMTDPEGSNFDPSFTVMRGNFTAGVNAYLRTELHFETELPYRSLANVGPWNFSNVENRYLDVAESLGQAMARNPHLHVWILAGHFDLAVSYFATDYTLRQMRLAPELRENIRFSQYDSGHMLYTDEEVLKQLKTDFQAFLGASASGGEAR